MTMLLRNAVMLTTPRSQSAFSFRIGIVFCFSMFPPLTNYVSKLQLFESVYARSLYIVIVHGVLDRRLIHGRYLLGQLNSEQLSD